jgi:hypothetical protein
MRNFVLRSDEKSLIKWENVIIFSSLKNINILKAQSFYGETCRTKLNISSCYSFILFFLCVEISPSLNNLISSIFFFFHLFAAFKDFCNLHVNLFKQIALVLWIKITKRLPQTFHLKVLKTPTLSHREGFNQFKTKRCYDIKYNNFT